MKDRSLYLIYKNGVRDIDLHGRTVEAFLDLDSKTTIVKVYKVYSDDEFVEYKVKEDFLQIRQQLEHPFTNGTFRMNLTIDEDIWR